MKPMLRRSFLDWYYKQEPPIVQAYVKYCFVGRKDQAPADPSQGSPYQPASSLSWRFYGQGRGCCMPVNARREEVNLDLPFGENRATTTRSTPERDFAADSDPPTCVLQGRALDPFRLEMMPWMWLFVDADFRDGNAT